MVEENQTYNDVDTSEYSITGGDSSPVEESTSQQTTESALSSNQETIVNSDPQVEESQLGSDGWGDDEVEYVDDEGNVYSMEQVDSWRKDSLNKSDWQKSNTQKSQQLSQLGKLFEAIDGDSKFEQHIKDYFYNNPNGLKDAGLDNAFEYDAESINEIPDDINPDDYLVHDDPHNQLMDRVTSLETEKNVQILESQLEMLENKYPNLLGNEKTEAFLKFVDESKVGDLDIGFRLWATDSLLEQQTQHRKLDENRQRNSGKVISNNTVGAKSVTTTERGPKAWNGISLDDPEISKYFDN
tara:strand:+ start:115 stop:1008 length:894 start_codon:yes stop_codon:yes gene_type:complete